jgi:LysM domain-containing protein
MAVRREELWVRPDARVLDFPVRIAQARARRAQRTFLFRRLMVGLIAFALVGAVIGVSALGSEAPVASRASAPASVVVQPGETLWELAERYAPPDSDPRNYVAELVELNGGSELVYAGTRLDLP